MHLLQPKPPRPRIYTRHGQAQQPRHRVPGAGHSRQRQQKDGFAPAFWTFTEHNGRCAGQQASGGVKRADFNYLTCGPLDRISLPFSFLPLRLDAEAAAATFTITGDNMHAYYGMPTLHFYDVNGVLSCRMEATDIAWNNSSIEGNTYALHYVPSGIYIVEIWSAAPSLKCGSTEARRARRAGSPAAIHPPAAGLSRNIDAAAPLAPEMRRASAVWEQAGASSRLPMPRLRMFKWLTTPQK